MRKPLVVGNWKMHGNTAENAALLEGLLNTELGTADVAVSPPSIYVAQVAEKLKSSAISWGVQNISAVDKGAYTGEISAPMAKDLECKFAIIGHSERRTLFGEVDKDVADKFVAAQQAGLTPIVCVGENLAEREAGETLTVVGRQLGAILAALSAGQVDGFVIAYEPVWAIGTGRTATPEQAQEVHKFIRDQLAAISAELAENIQILYGGSVKADNAEALFTNPDIDGGLVGGASLLVDQFVAICRAAG
ncbi:triose-phosphate isomerase [Zooshikella harenae]|uniref:Triosephosphate isomerase n=1 Tax=Zooshikella harenae TaxID=2827238 RepID=A0ABS5Z969_9GAMM|nr:triose-phosphate isomerase [Zooshikella harenae]MBU2710587.1 triose-phosphate isomerase [Zooshikella harenae]